jgi:hypothetical protein
MRAMRKSVTVHMAATSASMSTHHQGWVLEHATVIA